MSGKPEWMEGLSDAEVFAQALFSNGAAYGTLRIFESLHEEEESVEAFEFMSVAPIVPRWADTAVGITATFDDGSRMTFDTDEQNGHRYAVGAWETLSAEEWEKALSVAERFPIVWADSCNDGWLTHGAGRGAGGGDGFQHSAVCDSCGFDVPFLFRTIQSDPDVRRSWHLCHLCLTDEDYNGAS